MLRKYTKTKPFIQPTTRSVNISTSPFRKSEKMDDASAELGHNNWAAYDVFRGVLPGAPNELKSSYENGDPQSALSPYKPRQASDRSSALAAIIVFTKSW